jgi:hypothetical protein
MFCAAECQHIAKRPWTTYTYHLRSPGLHCGKCGLVSLLVVHQMIVPDDCVPHFSRH